MWANLQTTSQWCMSLDISKLLEALEVLPPVRAHLDPRLEVDLLLEKVLQALPRGDADLLEGGSLFADDDALLGLVRDVDDRAYADELLRLLEGLYAALARVGHLSTRGMTRGMTRTRGIIRGGR